MMHIGVDGSFWGGNERGVAVATRRLWLSYLEMTSQPEVTIFAPAQHAHQMPHSEVIPVNTHSPISRIVWQQFVLPRRARDHGIELLHCPSYTAPLSLSCKSIVTVHDLISWTHPQMVGWRNVLHFRLLVGKGIRRAGALCVPTDFIRSALINRFDISPSKVFVVPWGVDCELSPRSRDIAVSEVEQRYGIREPFVLFCGCIEPKKNLPIAIDACAEAGLLLVIVGPLISDSSRVFSLVHQETSSRWHYLGYVSPSDLSTLYSAAEALLFPSYTEGFGLPTVEAMSLGCPVIASDSPALLEVCGGAAIHASSSNTAGFASALKALVTDRTLRDSLVAQGKARARDFTWKNAVNRFSEAIEYAQR